MLIMALSRAEVGHLFSAQSHMGELQGVWKGTDPLEPGSHADVEIDVDRERSWSEIRLVQNEPHGFSASKEGLMICGLITDIDQYGTLAFMVGPIPLLVATSDPSPLGIVGWTACFHADDLEIYPYVV